MTEINKFRKQIDEIDKRILDLLDKRIKIAIKIGNLKIKQQLEVSQPVREMKIVERLKSLPSLLKPETIDSIWKEIISVSKEFQGSMNEID